MEHPTKISVHLGRSGSTHLRPVTSGACVKTFGGGVASAGTAANAARATAGAVKTGRIDVFLNSVSGFIFLHFFVVLVFSELWLLEVNLVLMDLVPGVSGLLAPCSSGISHQRVIEISYRHDRLKAVRHSSLGTRPITTSNTDKTHRAA